MQATVYCYGRFVLYRRKGVIPWQDTLLTARQQLTHRTIYNLIFDRIC